MIEEEMFVVSSILLRNEKAKGPQLSGDMKAMKFSKQHKYVHLFFNLPNPASPQTKVGLHYCS